MQRPLMVAFNNRLFYIHHTASATVAHDAQNTTLARSCNLVNAMQTQLDRLQESDFNSWTHFFFIC
jgi:hypothetical protein